MNLKPKKPKWPRKQKKRDKLKCRGFNKKRQRWLKKHWMQQNKIKKICRRERKHTLK